mmetsp:Transcript_8249/g.20976  ORF Transcript_8249/g.20976 Transcript_8249/m.20976 type:complete len:255 (+) Transcript_8249:33-797(+)
MGQDWSAEQQERLARQNGGASWTAPTRASAAKAPPAAKPPRAGSARSISPQPEHALRAEKPPRPVEPQPPAVQVVPPTRARAMTERSASFVRRQVVLRPRAASAGPECSQRDLLLNRLTLSMQAELELLRRATKAWEEGDAATIEDVETEIRVKLINPAKAERSDLELEVLQLRQQLELSNRERLRLSNKTIGLIEARRGSCFPSEETAPVPERSRSSTNVLRADSIKAIPYATSDQIVIPTCTMVSAPIVETA